MKQDRIWKVIALIAVVGLFYVGSALHRLAGGDGVFGQQAHAQLVDGAMTQDAEDVLITTSADGTRLYIWTFGPFNLNNRRIPEFRAEVLGPAPPAQPSGR